MNYQLNASKVSDIIATFESQRGLSLPQLLEFSSVLACQSYRYAESLGNLGKLYRQAYIDRKSKFSELVTAHKEQGDSVALAEHKARQNKEFKAIYGKECEYESRHEQGKLMFRAIDHVLSRMNQEIAELRKEREHQRHLQAT